MRPLAQTAASKYIGRWKHRLTLHFRVWPKYKETHDVIAKEKLIHVYPNARRARYQSGDRTGRDDLRARCSARRPRTPLDSPIIELGGLDFIIIGKDQCNRPSAVAAAARALALYLDPDNAAMFGDSERGKDSL